MRRQRGAPMLAAGWLALACTPAPPPSTNPPASPATTPVVESAAPPPAPAPSAAPARPSAAPPPRCPPAGPPPAVTPPEARTAQAGDGTWTAMGDSEAGERAAQGEPALFRTVVHPHPASRYVTVTLAALDLCRVRLGYVAGKDDLPKVEPDLVRGLVPETDRQELVAVFNGGYKPEHGKFGMLVSGHTLLPPRDGACTVGLTPAPGVSIGSAAPASDLLAYRQTPPCLLEQGQLHARLAQGNDRAWGGRAKDVVTRRRSALGIHESGRYLFYAVGVEAKPDKLAKALSAAGASAGAQLDINWYWTRFLLFAEREQRLAVSSSLIEGMEYQPTEYVERPTARDFFYVVRRAP